MSTKKFNNRYRIASARVEWWDYGKDSPYFITCCTEGRQHPIAIQPSFRTRQGNRKTPPPNVRFASAFGGPTGEGY